MDETRLPGAAKFKRGAMRSPPYKLLRAHPFRKIGEPPATVAYLPKQLSVWGNNQYGDCVTAEEAFAKACFTPEIFLADDVVIEWARRHGWLDGADLSSVLEAMQSDGFKVGGQQYNDGPHSGVDYSSESVLRSALSTGPVKIAIDANALTQGAGNQQGWYAVGGRPGEYGNTDHCVSLCGYGNATELFTRMGVPHPPAVPANGSGYLLFTWSTIGYVDHAWIMSTCTEAWIRTPTTVGVPPLPDPTPPTPPTPTPTPPGPSPAPTFWADILYYVMQVLPLLIQWFVNNRAAVAKGCRTIADKLEKQHE